MKNILLIILTIINLPLFSQQNMNEKLNQLFLDLDLSSTPEIMTKNSFLKFDYGISKGVEWTGGDSKMFIAKFDKHSLIKSQIKGGQIFIRQNNRESQLGVYEITERIDFHNIEDVINEFNKLSSIYEENSFKVKNLNTESTDYEITSQYNEIFFKSESKISKIIIGYSLPKENGQAPSLLISFKNIID